ncbi:MAG: ATP-binding protein [Pseudomonadota bacterium]
MSVLRSTSILASVLLPTLLLCYWAGSYTAPIPAIAQVESFAATGVELPATTDWKTVSLPKRRCQPDWAGCVEHLRASFNWDGTDTALAIPHFIGSVRVRVNERFVAEFGSVEPPIEFHNQTPGFASIDSSMLQPGDNKVHLMLTNRPRMFHRLQPFFIGPEEPLKSFFRPIKWLLQDVLWVSSGICLMLAFLSLIMSINLANKSRYLWFSIIMLCAVGRNSFPLLTDPSLDAVRVSIYLIASVFQLLAILGFIDNLSEQVRPRLYWALGLVLATSVAVLLFRIHQDPYLGGQESIIATNYLFLFLGSYILYRLARYLIIHRTQTLLWVSALFLASFILTANDALPIVVQQTNAQMQLAWLASLPLVLAFWLLLVHEQRRMHLAVTRGERDKQTAVQIERERIRRDLHDGIGGRIAGLAMLAKRKQQLELAEHLEASLKDVQQLMGQLGTEQPQPLAASLQEMAANLRAWLGSHKLALNWKQDNLDPGVKVMPAMLIELTRVFQELSNNVIKHARATHVTVRIVSQADVLNIDFRDDGVGIADIDFELARARGLHGVRKRCQSIGTGFAIDSQSPGLQVSFKLALGPFLPK